MRESYSIRWTGGDAGPCARCKKPAGSGPVGWQEGKASGPICDTCLEAGSPGLGAALRIVNLARETTLTSAPSATAMYAFRIIVGAYHKNAKWPAREGGLDAVIAWVVERVGQEEPPMTGGNGKSPPKGNGDGRPA